MPILISVESVLVGPDGKPILGPNGKPLDRIVRRTNSWLRQWPQIMKAGIQTSNEAGVLDTGGISRTVVSTPEPQSDASAPAGDNSHGIQLGTSSVAPTSTDNTLGALIANGSGVVQLNYQAEIVNPLVAIAGGTRVSTSRQVDNNSGSIITVEEVGLTVRQNTTAGVFTFLILRDLLNSVIPDATSRVFTYNLDFLV